MHCCFWQKRPDSGSSNSPKTRSQRNPLSLSIRAKKHEIRLRLTPSIVFHVPFGIK